MGEIRAEEGRVLNGENFSSAFWNAINYATMNATTPNAAAEAAVRAALARFNAAAKIGDAAGLDSVLAEELMYSHSNAKVEDKPECIAALVRSNIDFQEREPATILVSSDGGSAMVHGKMDAHNPGGVIVALHFMMMWVKCGEDWLLLGRHTAKLPN